MQCIVTADIHLANRTVNNKSLLEFGLKWLNALGDYAKKNKIKHIFIIGDLLHDKNPPLKVLLELQNSLATMKYKKDLNVIWIRGNHEVPLASNPSETYMKLFSPLCRTVIEEDIIHLEGNSFYCLPWYKGQPFLDKMEQMKKIAHNDTRKRFLLTHIGLNDGYVSKGYKIKKNVSLVDLNPMLWDRVLLGDYHCHQTLRSNAMYCGAPYQHTFGDSECEGAWVLDTQTNTCELVELPIYVPKFRTYQVLKTAGFPEVDFKDYIKLRVPADWLSLARTKYPYCDLEVLEDTKKEELDLDNSRLSTAKRDEESIVNRYLDIRCKDLESISKYRRIGMELLQEAKQ